MTVDACSWDHPQIRELIRLALREDIGSGDVTTEACLADDHEASGFFLPKQDLVLAGGPLLKLVYSGEESRVLHPDGAAVRKGQILARVRGSARRLLTLERTALNLLQRTCGVATHARRYAEILRGTACTLLDTRKTAPGMRLIDKLSVRAGGGSNHRTGLFDAILIKNNHIEAAGGIRPALERCASTGLSVEIEVRSIRELEEALACGAGLILLDNFSPDEVACAIGRIGGRARVEVSGNIGLDTIRAYADAGADFASVGALTHSAPAADISFRIE